MNKGENKLVGPIEEFLKEWLEESELGKSQSGAGRPWVMPALALWAGVLVGVVRGFSSQLEIWRLLAVHGLWDWPRYAVQDDALYKRLKTASNETLHHLFTQVTAVIQQRLPPAHNTLGAFASFARGVYALDNMTLDKVTKRLPLLRAKTGTVLPGKVATVFDLRAQLWRTIHFVENAQTNEKVTARELLAGLETGSLLLADLGFFAFQWFDELTEQGYFWVSRLRAKTSYEVIHVFYQRSDVLDALVWLGNYRADRAARAVRLVQFTHHGQTRAYLTNVLDPARLPLTDIPQLYARRWDIERMFNLVKSHLHLHWLWSSQGAVVRHQVYAVFTVAQIILGLRTELAERAQSQLEEVSLDLFIRWVPRLAQHGQDPLEHLVEVGRLSKIIRPASRTRLQLPELFMADYLPPPPDLPLIRPPRYAHKN